MSSLAFNTTSFYYFWAVELDNRTAAAQPEETDFRDVPCDFGCLTGVIWSRLGCAERGWGEWRIEGMSSALQGGPNWLVREMWVLHVNDPPRLLVAWAEVSMMSAMLFYMAGQAGEGQLQHCAAETVNTLYLRQDLMFVATAGENKSADVVLSVSGFAAIHVVMCSGEANSRRGKWIIFVFPSWEIQAK